ncbi:hypothetical protein [Shewanella salipaludis]|uniref:Phage shock protein B n=1 Tax=Shewanella salipaludis TaxID=2723052 RepID=A0A972JIT1_9GAMM|nr:hypothetical protein [Shewanella salipaludis]NMH65408.1 hypothetical protein [Shewanella salipaludis]
MNPFTLAAITIICVFAYKIFKEYNNKKSATDDETIQALQAEIGKLKTRVSTLETIVTDKNYQLGEEINRL